MAKAGAPRLCGIPVRNFPEYRKLQEGYEKQVYEKNKETGTYISPTSYKASTSNADLNYS